MPAYLTAEPIAALLQKIAAGDAAALKALNDQAQQGKLSQFVIESVEKAAAEKLKLSPADTLWNQRTEQHKELANQYKKYFFSLLISAVIVFMLVGWPFLFLFGVDVAKKVEQLAVLASAAQLASMPVAAGEKDQPLPQAPTAQQESVFEAWEKKEQSMLQILLPILVPFFFCVWALKVLGRLFAENLQIMRDASERETMIKTFINMVKGDENGKALAEDKDRIFFCRRSSGHRQWRVMTTRRSHSGLTS